MLTHYVDFDVIAGATQQDAALLHGRILSVSHFCNLGVHAFDFPDWHNEVFAGNVLRLFGTSDQLEKLLETLEPLINTGAVTHSQVEEVPHDATMSDYTYVRVKVIDSSKKRRFEARNPGKKWIPNQAGGDKRPRAYRIPMLSKSTGQTYPLYITRTSEKSTASTNNGLRINVPVFDKKTELIKPITVANTAITVRKDEGFTICRKSSFSKASVMSNIKAVFGENGLIVRDGGHYNPSQLQYAYAVADTLLSKRSDKAPPIGIIEAATGTGKTLGYLIPALLCAQENNARVVVSTHTKQLQQQLYNEDTRKAARYIEELTGRIIRIDRRFGRRNYLSLSACEAYLDHIKDDKKASDISAFIVKVKAWAYAKGSPLIVLSDYLDAHNLSSEDIPTGLDYSTLAIGAFSSNEELETYSERIKETNLADLLIVNHALSVINARSWMSALDADDRNDIHVFDEADKLDEAARSVACKDLSVRQTLKTILSGVANYSKACELETKGNVSKVESSFATALSRGNQLSPDVVSNIKSLLNGINKAVLKAATSIVTDHQDFKARMQKADFIDAYNELSFALTLIEQGATSMISASPVQGYPRLMVGQSNPARVLSRLWSIYDKQDGEEVAPYSNSSGVLFTSATLTSRTGSFTPFAQSVGVNTGINKSTGESFHNAVTSLWLSFENESFGEMSFVLPDQRIPHPSIESVERSDDDEKLFSFSEKWLSYAAGMIEAAQEAGGRTLVLTSSFKATRALVAKVRSNSLSLVIEHQQGENLNQYLPAFLAEPNSILITPSGWEGLNLPNTISHIVIPRIPFAPPSESNARLREADLKSKGLPIYKAAGIALSESVDNVVRKLKQGVGRGIRSKDDKVVVWLADPRFPIPVAYLASFDPVVMKFPRKQRQDLMGFVPKRFKNIYNSSPLFINGALYEVEV